MAATGAGEEDGFCDLLCNLRHWADRNKIDFDAEFERAERNYNAEIHEEA